MATQYVLDRVLPAKWFRRCATEGELHAAATAAFSYYSATLFVDGCLLAGAMLFAPSTYEQARRWWNPNYKGSQSGTWLALGGIWCMIMYGAPVIVGISGYRAYRGWQRGTLMTVNRVALPRLP